MDWILNGKSLGKCALIFAVSISVFSLTLNIFKSHRPETTWRANKWSLAIAIFLCRCTAFASVHGVTLTPSSFGFFGWFSVQFLFAVAANEKKIAAVRSLKYTKTNQIALFLVSFVFDVRLLVHLHAASFVKSNEHFFALFIVAATRCQSNYVFDAPFAGFVCVSISTHNKMTSFAHEMFCFFFFRSSLTLSSSFVSSKSARGESR